MNERYAVFFIISLMCCLMGYLLYHKYYENEPCHIVEHRDLNFPYHNDLLFIADSCDLYSDTDRVLIYSLGIKWLKSIDVTDLTPADKAYLLFIVEKLNSIVDDLNLNCVKI